MVNIVLTSKQYYVFVRPYSCFLGLKTNHSVIF